MQLEISFLCNIFAPCYIDGIVSAEITAYLRLSTHSVIVFPNILFTSFSQPTNDKHGKQVQFQYFVVCKLYSLHTRNGVARGSVRFTEKVKVRRKKTFVVSKIYKTLIGGSLFVSVNSEPTGERWRRTLP